MQENQSFYPTNWEPVFATLLGLVVYLALDDFQSQSVAGLVTDGQKDSTGFAGSEL